MDISKNKLYIIGFFIAMILSAMYIFSQEEDFDKEHLKLYSLYFEKHNEYVHIHTYSYGLLGNHSKIIISKNKIRNAVFNPQKDIFAKGVSTIFYKKTQDTLYLFPSSNLNIPTNFISKVKIVQKDLENAEFVKLLETYPSNGLGKIRIK